MSELTEVKNQQVAQIPTDQVELIKRTVAKGATDDELQMFLHLAQAYGLDPFAKEIWFIKRLKKVKIGDGWDYPRLPNGDLDYSNCDAPVIMTSRDGYLKIAQRDENYEGLQSFVVREGDDFSIDAVNNTFNHKFSGNKRGKILGAWAICKRKGRDPQLTFIEFDEYNDANSPIWKKYPSAMIQKVAEVFVLKRQFGISGLTTREEMPMEYDLTNVSEKPAPTQLTSNDDNLPQIPEHVGDYTVTIKGTQTKLSEMTMKQLNWLTSKSKNETTRAMASAYIDELQHNGKEIEGDAVIHNEVPLEEVTHKQPDLNTSDPVALFGGAAI